MNQNQLLVELGLRMEKFRAGMKEATGRLTAFSERAQSIGRDLSFAFSLPMAFAARSVIRDASSIEQAVSKIGVVFKESAGEVDAFTKTTLEQFGIARQTALSMTSLYGDMATGLGMATGDAAKLSIQLTKLAGDLASAKDVRLDVAQTALAGVFTGETESLKQLGIVMLEANVEAFALRNGINAKMQKMTEAQKIALRYAYIMEQTKNAQGDFARTSGEAANQTRVLQERAKEISGQIGTTLLPLYVSLVSSLNEVAKVVSQTNPKWLKFGAILAGVLAIGIPVATMFLSLVSAIKAAGVASALASAGWVALGAVIVGAGVAAYVFRDDIKRALLQASIAVNEFLLNTAFMLNNSTWFKGKFTEDIKLAMKSIQSAGAQLKQTGPAKTVKEALSAAVSEVSSGMPALKDIFNKYMGTATQEIKNGGKELTKAGIEEAKHFGRSLVAAFEAQRPALTEVISELMNPRAAQAGRLGSVIEDLGLDPEKLLSYTSNLQGRLAEVRTNIANFTSGAAGTISESTIKFIEEGDKMKQALKSFNDEIAGIALDFGRNVIEGVFTKAFGGEYDWRAMFGGLFRAISQAMAELGKKLLLMGVGELALFSLGPGAKIAAGVALLAASGIAGAASNTIGQRSQVARQAGNFNAAPSFNIQGNLVARGPDLVAVFNETNSQFG